MPWCERCDRFLNPNTVNADGTCPTCGRLVDPGRVRTDSDPADEGVDVSAVDLEVLTEPDGGAEEADEEYKAPWHFWVMVAGVVIYLGWRLFEAIIWGWDRLF